MATPARLSNGALLETSKPRNRAPHSLPGCILIKLQFYAFGCIGGNLYVPQRFRQNSREHEMFGKFLRDEAGATAIEYSLIAGFIALAIIAAVGMTGQRLVALFESLIPALTLP